MDEYTLLHGDCLEVMAAMDAGSVDAVVCDPPYGLEFMGKEWDKFRVDDPGTNRHRGNRAANNRITKSSSDKPRAKNNPWEKEASGYVAGKRSQTYRCTGCGKRDQFRNAHGCDAAWKPELVDPHAAPPSMLALQEWSRGWATEAYRVLKPSHYLLAFGGTRTWHRLACAIEDAGFEIRDTLMWLYGSGFPKGKACLKPSWEPIILARKPGPMRELGIEECRIAGDEDGSRNRPASALGSSHSYAQDEWTRNAIVQRQDTTGKGRWPANLILECTCDETREGTAKTPATYTRSVGSGNQNAYAPGVGEPAGATSTNYGDENGKEPVRIHTDPNCPCAMLDGQTGNRKSASSRSRPEHNASSYHIHDDIGLRECEYAGDSGGASRFFYCAKASRSERNAGCEGMDAVVRNVTEGHGLGPMNTSKSGDGIRENRPTQNHHPTVKPLALMRWLVKLVARSGDVVLDPFMGSGTTGVACAMEGREFVGIEREAEYLEIARRRIEAASAQERLPV